jgi:predicted transposase YdaD
MIIMASTDSPLKQLVESCITDFATWLLKGDVKHIQPLNVELQDQKVLVDQLYRVTLADEHVIKLHIEFQGPRSHESMQLRMLDYMTRHVKADPDLDLHSVVFYVGKGAGADDEGRYQVNGVDGQPVLKWR